MTFGSLFSGIGGFDRGLEQAGMEVRWQCEIDRDCQSVLRRHWPGVQLSGDIRDLGAHNLEPVDVLCGGSPCQNVSVAGRREGLAGDRSGLWYEFRRVIEELAPSWVLVENVPGLLSCQGGRDFGTVLTGLVQLGYRCAWRVLDAQYFGVPQRRQRVFLVGHLGDGRAAEVLFEREGVRWDPPSRREAGEAVARGAGVSAPGRGRRNGLSPQPLNLLKGGVGFALTASPTATERLNPSCQTFVASTLSASLGHHGHSSPRGDGSDNLVLAFCERGRDEGRNLEAQEELAYALTNPGAGGRSPSRNLPQPGIGVRRLTPRECERLQGFPDDWTRWRDDGREVSDSARYRMLGNAVAVPVAAWLGRRILGGE